jgi:hypothetical protein
MGHRAKAALVGATVRLMCQETRIRVTRRHLIRFIRLRPGRPAVNRVLHLRAAILILEADRHRVGILPAAAAAAVVEEAARAVVEAVAPLAVVAGARTVVVEAVEDPIIECKIRCDRDDVVGS